MGSAPPLLDTIRPLVDSPWWPHAPTPMQWVALSDYAKVPEVLYGGSAGGGKSEYLLFWASLYASKPDSHVMLFRRTFADLALDGALLDRAKQWWLPRGVRYESQQHRFVFPSGATVSFGYLHAQDDRYRYQGTELTGVGFDEAGQLRPEDMTYLASRVRAAPGSQVPLGIRYASNPGGPAHDFLKQRFVRGGDPEAVYLPARLTDNPFIDQTEYRRFLARLDPIERARLEDGDWDVLTSGGFFEVEKIGLPPDRAEAARARVRAWDLAATPDAPGTDPDYTVGILMAEQADGQFTVEEMQRFRAGPAEVEARIGRTAQRDGRDVIVVVEQEPGSSGVLVRRQLATGILRGFRYRSERHTGRKWDRAKPLAAAIANQLVEWAPAAGRLDALAELRAFQEDPKAYAHDDIVDACAMAYNELTRAKPRPMVIGRT